MGSGWLVIGLRRFRYDTYGIGILSIKVRSFASEDEVVSFGPKRDSDPATNENERKDIAILPPIY